MCVGCKIGIVQAPVYKVNCAECKVGPTLLRSFLYTLKILPTGAQERIFAPPGRISITLRCWEEGRREGGRKGGMELGKEAGSQIWKVGWKRGSEGSKEDGNSAAIASWLQRRGYSVVATASWLQRRGYSVVATTSWQ